MQSLLSQLHGMSAESKGLAAPPTNDPDSASIINKIHRNQHETQQVLQNVVQAISKLSVSDTVDPLLEQRTQSESSVYDVATSMKPLNASIDQSAEIEKLNSLSMAVMRPGKTMRLCSPNCRCSCHVQSVFRTPQLLQQITGYLLLGYSGSHILQQQCIPSCLRNNAKSIQMIYFFPRWFVSRAISVSLANTISPTFSIKFRRVVPEASQLFSLSKFGDVDGIKSLFDNGLASPDDVHIRGGWTALHVKIFSISYSYTDPKLTATSLRWIMAVWTFASC